MSSPAPSRLNGASVGIPLRRLDFAFSRQSPRYFFDGNGFASLFLTMLSGWFPPGERFFMDSVRHYRGQISDPVLQAKVAGFIAQEAMHGKEHDTLNRLLNERGLRADQMEKAVGWALGLLRQLPPQHQLAATVAMEHFTALLAERLLQDERFQRRGDPEILPLWLWHALEELEHKAVAYEVFEEVCGDYQVRLTATLAMILVMLPTALLCQAWLLLADRRLLAWADNARGLELLFGQQGFVSSIVAKYGVFFRRNFHPNGKDHGPLIREWQDRLFGQEGSLQAQLKNSAAA